MVIISPDTLRLFRGIGRCEFCKKLCRSREPHHIVHRGIGGGRRLDIAINLIALGKVDQCLCHHDYHLTGRILATDFDLIVAGREGCLQDEIRAVRNMLKRLDQHALPYHIRVALDGLNDGARLVAVRTLKEHGIKWEAT